MRDVEVPSGDDVHLDMYPEIPWSCGPCSNGVTPRKIGLKVRCSPDGEEETLVRFNVNPGRTHVPPDQVVTTRELILDVSRSSMSPDVSNRESQRSAFEVPIRETSSKLRIFVDRSVVEVIADRRHYVGKRIYPVRPDSVEVRAYARGGRAALRSFDAWRMNAIWP